MTLEIKQLKNQYDPSTCDLALASAHGVHRKEYIHELVSSMQSNNPEDQEAIFLLFSVFFTCQVVVFITGRVIDETHSELCDWSLQEYQAITMCGSAAASSRFFAPLLLLMSHLLETRFLSYP